MQGWIYHLHVLGKREPLAEQNTWSETASKREEHKCSQPTAFVPPNVLPAPGRLWIGQIPKVLFSVFSGLEWIYFCSELAHSFSNTIETFNIHRFYSTSLTGVFVFFLLSVFLSWNFTAFSFWFLVTFHLPALVLPRNRGTMFP